MTMEQMAQRIMKSMTPLQIQELTDGRFDQLTIVPMVVLNVDENKAIRVLEKCRELSNG